MNKLLISLLFAAITPLTVLHAKGESCCDISASVEDVKTSVSNDDKSTVQDKKAPKKNNKSTKNNKNKKQEDEVIEQGKVPGKVYIFGCSSEFGDSILYITDINEIDSLALHKKTKFLPYRSDFSQQLKDDLENFHKLKNQTTSVFFSDKKNKLEKVQKKLKKRYLQKSNMKIVTIGTESFKFVHPVDYVYGETNK